MVEQQLYKAAISYFTAQRDEALAVLSLCFTKPVAVGSHPEILNDIKEWTQKLASAEDALTSLQRNFHLDTGRAQAQPQAPNSPPRRAAPVSQPAGGIVPDSHC